MKYTTQRKCGYIKAHNSNTKVQYSGLLKLKIASNELIFYSGATLGSVKGALSDNTPSHWYFKKFQNKQLDPQ